MDERSRGGPAATRLQLRPGLLTAWRAVGCLQVGAGEGAVVLEGLTGAEEQLLSCLDGGFDDAGVRSRAAALGVPEHRLTALVAGLGAAGALAPSLPTAGTASLAATPGARAHAAVLGLAADDGDGWSALARRAAARVLVDGASSTGLALALGLASAGVGAVAVEDDAPVTTADVAPGGYTREDVGRPRAERARAHVAARSARCRTGEGPLHAPTGTTGRPAGPAPERPDVVVLLGAGAIDPRRTEALVREGVPHLAVLWRGASTSVGPLVRPGSSTCLRCLDLHRTDRDPRWPAVGAQLARGGLGGRARPEEPALAALTAALACQQVLAQVAGEPRPSTLDATVEVTLATGAVAVRPWSPHPRCGCTWPGRGWEV